MDLNGHPIAATTQYLYPNMVARVEHDLGLDVTSYFNSGVLLLDLDAWRTNGLTDALAEHVRKHMRQLVWPDQDALNGVLHSQRTPLHPRWNAMPGLWELPMRQLPYTRDEVAEARDDPAIVHFLGPYKPWHYRSKSPYRADWFRYLERTPWRGRKIEGRRPVHALLRLLPAPSAYRAEALLGPWAARLDAATSRLRRHG
jgi:lipopolysaccharide biosynthesis glycosyltransferase